MLGLLLLFDSACLAARTLIPTLCPLPVRLILTSSRASAYCQGFAGNDSNDAPSLWLQRNRARRNSLLSVLFGLVVPRKFVAPNTQQWNLTIQRSLGHDWIREVGYIGTHAVHLRETRTFGALLATADHPLTVVAAGWHALSHHREHLRQRPCALPESGH